MFQDIYATFAKEGGRVGGGTLGTGQGGVARCCAPTSTHRASGATRLHPIHPERHKRRLRRS
ncbi:sulfate adenylyltransferase large subunit [Streptomyces venezuelae]|uniref:Sulfate adenylyltransferase n=1 Tax=Streptomyces gardneri TaxID=66892 RepID=A0A4Y3RF91_9ACTN|nr:sulfate adenylyltransferase large subunit [Streptomyces venezuelae]GEB56325.1 hypothetical protein SGA01_19300 [Streptomyces gardneri]GHG99764.1 hypothetical protein GCM10017674_34660 [Streptomyces gardneri]